MMRSMLLSMAVSERALGEKGRPTERAELLDISAIKVSRKMNPSMSLARAIPVATVWEQLWTRRVRTRQHDPG